MLSARSPASPSIPSSLIKGLVYLGPPVHASSLCPPSPSYYDESVQRGVTAEGGVAWAQQCLTPARDNVTGDVKPNGGDDCGEHCAAKMTVDPDDWVPSPPPYRGPNHLALPRATYPFIESPTVARTQTRKKPFTITVSSVRQDCVTPDDAISVSTSRYDYVPVPPPVYEEEAEDNGKEHDGCNAPPALDEEEGEDSSEEDKECNDGNIGCDDGYDADDEAFTRLVGVQTRKRSAEVLDEEVEKVSDDVAQAEDDTLSVEEVGSDYNDSGGDASGSSSESEHDDPDDEDYNPDEASEPPPEDNYGVPLVSIEIEEEDGWGIAL